ncbi:MAG: hypothetical protein GF329_20940 [Candidatus Lokiarchaeota archaeon]|nr:hypothetical protein [Candidatus Lokiarchaeota archaeon]
MRQIYDIPNIVCIKKLVGHTETVEDVVIDEDVIITSSRDKTIRIWNKDTWECETILKGHEDRIISLAINESYIVSGSQDKTIRIWNRSTGKCEHVLEGHDGGVNDIDIQDGLIVSGSDDTTVKLWDINSGKLLKTFNGHQRIVSRVRIRGNHIFSASWDHFVKTWDIETEECIESYEIHFDAIDAMDVNKDATLIITGDQSSVINVWDRASREVLQTLRGHNHFIMDLLIKGGVIYSCSQDRSVILWDLKSGTILKKLEGHIDAVMNVDKYKNLIASASADGTIRIWDDFSTYSIKTLKKHVDIVLGIATNGDLVASVGTENKIYIWDIEKAEVIREIDTGVNSWIWGIAMEEDRVIISSDEGVYRIFDINTGEPLKTLERHDGPTYRVSLKRNIAVTDSSDNTVKIWDIDKSKCVRTLRGHTFPTYTNVIIDDNIISSGSDGSVRCWDRETGDCFKVFREHTDEVFHLATEGNLVVSASADNTLKVFNIDTQECVSNLIGHTDQVWTVQIKNGIVFSGSIDSTIKVWDVETGNCLETFKGHTGAIKDLCIVGNYLLSGSKDSFIKVWDISNYLANSEIKEGENRMLLKQDDILVALLQIGRAYDNISERLGDPDLVRWIYGLKPLDTPENRFGGYNNYIQLIKDLIGNWRFLGHIGFASWINDIVKLGREDELQLSETESLETVLHEYLVGLKEAPNMFWFGLLRYLGENPIKQLPRRWSFDLEFSGQGPTPLEGFDWIKLGNRENIVDLADRNETALVFRLTLKNVIEWLIPLIKSIEIQIKDDRGDLEYIIFNNFLPLEENEDVWNAIAMFKIDPGYCNEPNAMLEITDIRVNYDNQLTPEFQGSGIIDKMNYLKMAQDNLRKELNNFKNEIKALLIKNLDSDTRVLPKKEIKFSEVDLSSITVSSKHSLLKLKNSRKSSEIFNHFKKGFHKPGFDTIKVAISGTFSKFLENIEPKFILFSTITSITSAVLTLFVYLSILNPALNIFGPSFEIFGNVITLLEMIVYFFINGLLIVFLVISVLLWIRYYKKKKKMKFQV